MADRTRPIRIEFCVTEQERHLIRHKMAQFGTENMGAYLRKLAIDGYIVKVDYTEQKKLAATVSRVATNINRISDGPIISIDTLAVENKLDAGMLQRGEFD